MRWIAICIALMGAAFAWGGANGKTINGVVTEVHDGDTFLLKSADRIVRIRLFGADAQELGQTCTAPDRQPWHCDLWAKEQLKSLILAKTLSCRTKGKSHDRTLAICLTNNGVDVAEKMIEIGAAADDTKYTEMYIDAEKRALIGGRGIWSGGQVQPWVQRKRLKPPEQQPPNILCPIKGNVSANGNIYHIPGQRDYAGVQISENRGEQWFCSEADARAAGWRKAAR